jgi:hypothetical protein
MQTTREEAPWVAEHPLLRPQPILYSGRPEQRLFRWVVPNKGAERAAHLNRTNTPNPGDSGVIGCVGLIPSCLVSMRALERCSATPGL